MMKVSEFKGYLEQQFPSITFYNGSIDKNKKQCVGVYAKGSASSVMPLGGPTNGSYGQLPISILVHWSENSDQCEDTANTIYNHLYGLSNVMTGGRRIISVRLLDPTPVDLQRDNQNICEMVIRAIILYDKEVS